MGKEEIPRGNLLSVGGLFSTGSETEKRRGCEVGEVRTVGEKRTPALGSSVELLTLRMCTCLAPVLYSQVAGLHYGHTQCQTGIERMSEHRQVESYAYKRRYRRCTDSRRVRWYVRRSPEGSASEEEVWQGE